MGGGGWCFYDLLETGFPDSSFSVSDQRPALFTSIQRSVLETVAASCPYDYGPGVYMARAMLSAADTTLYTAINDCEKGPQPASQRLAQPENETVADSENPYRFNLYPNPNKGQFQFNIATETSAVYRVDIQDMKGKLLYRSTVYDGISNLDVSTLNAGIYVLSVTDDDISLYNERVVLFE